MTASTFISYSKLDRPVAEALCAALEANGTRCWIAPRDISPSREWAEEIIDGINGAQVMLLVFSSRSNGSPQVRREVERAIHKEVPVIPFRIENVPSTKSLEYFLSSQHWFDAFDEPLEAYLPRLCDLLAALCLNRPPALEKVRMPMAATAATAAPTLAFAFAPAELGMLESLLAVHVGPIARVLVRRAAARSKDQASLIGALADELDLPRERTAFTTACGQQFPNS